MRAQSAICNLVTFLARNVQRIAEGAAIVEAGIRGNREAEPGVESEAAGRSIPAVAGAHAAQRNSAIRPSVRFVARKRGEHGT